MKERGVRVKLFEIGDYVVHGNNGVCKVDAVQEMDMGKSTRTYYTLLPLYAPGSRTVCAG